MWNPRAAAHPCLESCTLPLPSCPAGLAWPRPAALHAHAARPQEPTTAGFLMSVCLSLENARLVTSCDRGRRKARRRAVAARSRADGRTAPPPRPPSDRCAGAYQQVSRLLLDNGSLSAGVAGAHAEHGQKATNEAHPVALRVSTPGARLCAPVTYNPRPCTQALRPNGLHLIWTAWGTPQQPRWVATSRTARMRRYWATGGPQRPPRTRSRTAARC